jgi:hypothetical protein
MGELPWSLLGNLAVVLGRDELTLATNGAIMRLRGRALAAATGARWPADFQQATLAYLQRELGMDVEV